MVRAKVSAPRLERRDNHGLTPPGAGFQPLLLFLLASPTLQGAPQIRARTASVIPRCCSHAFLSCMWTRDGEMGVSGLAEPEVELGGLAVLGEGTGGPEQG